jgi:AraC-like DNA-binding protein
MSENNTQQSTNQATKTLTSIKVVKAIRLLEMHIDEIPDVQTWAEEVGVSRRWLCKYMKREYNKSPKIIIRDARFEVIKECLRSGFKTNQKSKFDTLSLCKR